MKRPLRSILVMLIISSTFINHALAAEEPIPGVDVVVRKKPGGHSFGTVQTGKDGRFAIKLAEGGYDLSIMYDQIEKALTEDKYFKQGSEVTLMLDNGNWDVARNGKPGEDDRRGWKARSG